MFVSTGNYLKRIAYALEHVAAPRIEDDFARGQVLAAVFLIDNLSDRIDYKPDLIAKEIGQHCEVIKAVVEPLAGKAAMPVELREFVEELDRDGMGADIDCRTRCEAMFSLAVDYFFENRGELAAEASNEINAKVVKHITGLNMRDLGLFKISTSSKLIQSKDKS